MNVACAYILVLGHDKGDLKSGLEISKKIRLCKATSQNISTPPETI